MIWYDKIAKIYDLFSESFYRKARKELVNAANLQKGDRLLVIACGTGQSFSFLREKIGDSGVIIAFDYSVGMLKQAEKRIEKNNWKNIHLFQMDARNLSVKVLRERGIDSDFDFVLGELAFSVIPEWEKIMEIGVGLLKSGGRLGLLDWYRPERDIMTKVVDFLAEAETTRKTFDFANNLIVENRIVCSFFLNSVFVWIGVNHRQEMG